MDKRTEFLADMADDAREALRHIIAMLDKYPEALLPTPLLAAIESGRRLVE